MTQLRLTIVFSLTALLSGGLVLPHSATADEEARHEEPRQDRQQQRDDEWYLLRHREARPYGYRTIELPASFYQLEYQQRAVAPAVGRTIML